MCHGDTYIIAARRAEEKGPRSGPIFSFVIKLLYNVAGVESAHSGEALLPDVGYTSASGDGRPGSSSRGSGARLKKNRRGENTPLIRAGAGARHRSEYEDLDDEAFNNWPSKSETYY